jgi:hypothetical protein
MPADLRTQLLADRDREGRHLGRLDPALTGDHHRELGDGPARPARQKDDALAQADCLADVVSDEQDRQPGVPPDPLEFLVEEVASDGIQRPEWLVEQEDLRFLGEGTSEGDSLAHPT